MKKNVLLIVLAVCLSANAPAQRKGPSMARDNRMIELKNELSLSDDQVENLRNINKDFRVAYFGLHADSTLTHEARLTKRKQLASIRKDSIKRILTNEQYEKWLTMNSKEASYRTSVNRTEWLQQEAGLSDEQVKKLDSIDSVMMQRFGRIRTDSTLTRESRMEAQRQVMRERNTAIRQILTPEQYGKLEAFQKRRMMVRMRGGKHQQR